eukprot:5073690-Alexandrium_andersonii.AAC.1
MRIASRAFPSFCSSSQVRIRYLVSKTEARKSDHAQPSYEPITPKRGAWKQAGRQAGRQSSRQAG